MNDGTTYLIFLELPVKDLWGTLVPICRVALIKKVSPNYGGRVHRNTLGAHLTKSCKTEADKCERLAAEAQSFEGRTYYRSLAAEWWHLAKQIHWLEREHVSD
jgi:hypothetical protein